MPAATPDAPEPERQIRRAVEIMQCGRKHAWRRLRDASGYVNRKCPECGAAAKRQRVVTMRLTENPGQGQDGREMWNEG